MRSKIGLRLFLAVPEDRPAAYLLGSVLVAGSLSSAPADNAPWWEGRSRQGLTCRDRPSFSRDESAMDYIPLFDVYPDGPDHPRAPTDAPP